MKAMSLKLPNPLFVTLALRAQASALSQSEVVRAALAAYLATPLPGSAGPTCARQATRWSGMVQGPADLATNPAHTAGFGG